MNRLDIVLKIHPLFNRQLTITQQTNITYRLLFKLTYTFMKGTIFIPVLLVVLLFSCGEKEPQNRTEVIWDKWGVPHVYAGNEADMYYAFGWVQMQHHANLILKLYAEARGRAAEYFGEEYLESDQMMHLFNLPDSSAAQYDRTTDTDKQLLDAFVKGLNDYAKAHPDKIDERVKVVLPVSAVDVLSHGKRVMNLEFLGGKDIRSAVYEIKESRNEIIPGSNSYAIAPSKSASGNAMLVANPHLPWSDFYLFFEAHLNAPGFNVYGVTLVGMPVLNIAFNEQLGWTHTVNTIDASDRYELTLQDGGYLLDGKTKPFEEKSISIKVLQKDGTTQEKDIRLKYSQHGPVIGETDDKAYAVRIAGLEKDSYYAQYHRMGKAGNMDEFEEALRMMQIPMFNLVYADKEGNIIYLFNGNIPVRKEGDWSFWNGKVDGSRSDLIWNSYHNLDDLPKLVNPETGFVQNANDAPWTSTYPVLLNPDDFAPYMSPKPEERPTSFRAQRAINLIKDDDSISFEELVDYKLNTGMEVADRFLDDLLAAVELFPDSLAMAAGLVLQKWDGETNADSKGAVLFGRWFDKLENDIFAIPWSVESPLSTPDGLNNPEKAVALLSETARKVVEEYGSIDVAWGDVNRFRINDIEFPGNGSHHDHGVFRTVYFSPHGENRETGNSEDQEKDLRNTTYHKNYAYHGDTFVAVIEFGETVRAEILLSYGNASQPGNKFAGNQLELLSKKQLRSAFLSREDILKNMVFKKVFLNKRDRALPGLR